MTIDVVRDTDGWAHFLYNATTDPEVHTAFWCSCHQSFGKDVEAALVHLREVAP